jgi:putative addiction module component (TIGR02574 family)
MTLEQIVEESRQLPREQVAELVDRLTLALHQSLDPAIEDAWKQETRRRVTDIRNGTVSGAGGEEVAARIRRIVGR